MQKKIISQMQEFRQGDAGEFMVKMAENDQKADVVFMDPPRAGSDVKFLSSVVKLNPKKVVYIHVDRIRWHEI